MTSDALALLVAFQHIDAIFPSGSFAFSSGLEARAELASELGALDLEDFIAAQICHRWATSDRIALVKAHRACGDLDAIAHLDAEVEASTLSEAFRQASRRNGMALLTAHERLGTPGAAAYRSRARSAEVIGHLAIVQGFCWQALGVEESVAALMSGYAAASALTSAAVRLHLVGAIAAQAALARALPLIARAAQAAVGDNAAFASFLPLAEIAAARHGTTGSRLFSN
jgi:urease accessory protein